MAKSKVITVSEFSNSTAANSAKRISDINNIQISITEMVVILYKLKAQSVVKMLI